MKCRTLLTVFFAALFVAASANAADDLKLNPRLNYSSDSQDGALITGTNMDDGFVAGQPNYVIFYGEG